MLFKIPSIERLIHELSRLPGIGEKSAQRLAYFILKNKEDFPEKLSLALQSLRTNVSVCKTCYNYTEITDICEVCDSSSRSRKQICVVEEAFDIAKIEAYGKFRGLYHVLGGSLSPLHGVGPDNLKIKELLKRLEASKTDGNPVEEVILALDADLEGDTTALFIAKQLEGQGIRVSRLAYGIPFGSDIDYIDNRTLGKAFENRVELECHL
ncbi:MAG: recombination protein RecR [Bdellovibrionales bacterium]|nr:recombination protein RecR [Bdellovibrionales bacterium]